MAETSPPETACTQILGRPIILSNTSFGIKPSFWAKSLRFFPEEIQSGNQPGERSQAEDPQKKIIEKMHRGMSLYSQTSFLLNVYESGARRRPSLIGLGHPGLASFASTDLFSNSLQVLEGIHFLGIELRFHDPDFIPVLQCSQLLQGLATL